MIGACLQSAIQNRLDDLSHSSSVWRSAVDPGLKRDLADVIRDLNPMKSVPMCVFRWNPKLRCLVDGDTDRNDVGDRDAERLRQIDSRARD